jgi:hypothetical protein
LYIIFFLLGFIFTILYGQKTALLNTQLSAGPAPSIGVFNSTPGNLTIVPQAIIDGCNSGGSLFSITVNTENGTFASILGAQDFFFDRPGRLKRESFFNLVGITSQLNSLSLGSAIELNMPSLSGFTSLTGINFNTSSLASTNLTLPFDVASKQASITAVADGLTLTTFNPNWNSNSIATNLASFNNFALTVNANHVAYTEAYVISTYIAPGVTFDPATVSGSANNGNNNQLTTLYNTAEAAIKFNRSGNIAIANTKATLNRINALLTSVNSTRALIERDLATTAATTLQLSQDVNSTFANVNALLAYQNSTLKTSITTAIDACKTVSVDTVTSFLGTMYDEVVVALLDMVKCKVITAPLSNTLSVLIDTLT